MQQDAMHRPNQLIPFSLITTLLWVAWLASLKPLEGRAQPCLGVVREGTIGFGGDNQPL